MVVHITHAVLAIIQHLNVSGSSDKTIFEKIFENSISMGKWLFFQDIQNTNLNSTPNVYSIENIAFGSSSIILTMNHNWIDYNVFSVVCGALPLMFLVLTGNFVSSILESTGREEDASIFSKFQELKVIARSLNSVWGVLVLNYVLEVSLRIIWIHESQSRGKIFFVSLCIQIAFLVVALIIMAEGCRFVRSSKV